MNGRGCARISSRRSLKEGMNPRSSDRSPGSRVIMLADWLRVRVRVCDEVWRLKGAATN